MATASNTIGLTIKEKGAKQATSKLNGVTKAILGLAGAYISMKGVSMAVRGVTKLVLKSVAAYTNEVKAVESLRIVTKENTQALEDYANAIQKVTILGNEDILNISTRLAVLGVHNDQLKEATVNTLGLGRAIGTDYLTSARYYALALQGQTSILARYIPELRNATNEVEKFQAVQNIAKTGLKLLKYDAKIDVDVQLKNEFGDKFMENFGSTIMPQIQLVKKGLMKMMDTKEFTNFATELGGVIGEGIEGAVKVAKSAYGGLLGIFKSNELQSAFLAAVDNTEAIDDIDTRLYELRKRYATVKSYIPKLAEGGQAQITALNEIARLRTAEKTLLKERGGLLDAQRTTQNEYKDLLAEQGSLLAGVTEAIKQVDMSQIIEDTGAVLSNIKMIFDIISGPARLGKWLAGQGEEHLKEATTLIYREFNPAPGTESLTTRNRKQRQERLNPTPAPPPPTVNNTTVEQTITNKSLVTSEQELQMTSAISNFTGAFDKITKILEDKTVDLEQLSLLGT